MTTARRRPIPVYTTVGDVGAYLVYPILYNLRGEWIGFITPDKDVYNVGGLYVGFLTNDPRIFRKKSFDFSKPKLIPPPRPPKFLAPASTPLAPMMSDLPFDVIDVLQDEPDRLPTPDMGELKEDMD